MFIIIAEYVLSDDDIIHVQTLQIALMNFMIRLSEIHHCS